MSQDFQKKMCTFLIKNGIKNFVGVPDSTLKNFIQEALDRKKIIITTREEEAIGIAPIKYETAKEVIYRIKVSTIVHINIDH